MTKPLLELSHLGVIFTRRIGLVGREYIRALHDVSFSLARGEIIAVIGASGAGKSVMSQAILSLLPQNAQRLGAVRFEGEALSPTSTRELRGRAMAFVPQSVAALDPSMTIGDQIALAARRAGRRVNGPGHALIAASLERYGLAAEVARLYPHHLSGGMARRVLIAMASVAQPALLIADEPGAGMDPETLTAVSAHFEALAHAGTGILLISHDIISLIGIAHRIVVLREGQLMGIETRNDFSEDGRMLKAAYSRALWQALPENGFIVPRKQDWKPLHAHR